MKEINPHFPLNPLKKLRLSRNLMVPQVAAAIGRSKQVIWSTELGLYTQPPPSLVDFYAKTPEDKMQLRMGYAEWVITTRHLYANSFVVTEPVETFFEYMIAVGGSEYGFCRSAVLQKSIVHDYLRKGYRWKDVAQALRHCGVDESTIEFLGTLPTGKEGD